ncbi:alkaline phosphatase family protein [Nocardioides jensenii]|uniref:alkaline phosphatase family protein n=1 Tax=Nocardioides jensenii TaxID=1843 RepID=UPI00082CD7B9|nr:alkaline phosphatase family protein [Nocardioides jensenii]
MNETRRLRAVLAVVVLALVVAVAAFAWGRTDDSADRGADSDAPSGARPTDEPSPSQANPGQSEPVSHVIAVSVDALSVPAIRKLGPTGTPVLHRLIDEGSSTLNARSAFEQNVTLPNHAGMITGRRISAGHGGHGVTWNVDRPHDTVQASSGDPEIESIFSVAHDHGLSTALYASKDKFDIFTDSWPDSIDTVHVLEDDGELVTDLIDQLDDELPALTFLHLDAPDATGHEFGGMSPEYLAAVTDTDEQLGRLVDALEERPEVDGSTTIVLTADHGFIAGATTHSAHVRANYTIPFVVWGSHVSSGDLYAINRRYADPGTSRPSYAGRQPVRNLDLADVAMEALGLPDVVDRRGRPDLRWRTPVS